MKIHPKILQARIDALRNENLKMIALLSGIATGNNNAEDAKVFIRKMLVEAIPAANNG